MKTAIISLYNLILALWVGGMSLFTFIVTPVIFKSHARDAAGSIVSHLFPYYFLYNLTLSGTALFVFMIAFKNTARWFYLISLILLATALIANLVLVTFIYPQMEKLKSATTSFESVSHDIPERKAFMKLHAVSSILNLVILLEGIVLMLLQHVSKSLCNSN